MTRRKTACMSGVALLCAILVLAGSGPPVTDKTPASTAELTATFQVSVSDSAPALTSDELPGKLPAATGGQMSRNGVIWDNYPSGWGGAGWLIAASQLDLNYPFDSQVADDFLFDWDMTIDDVHWAGGYWGPGYPGNPTAFYILFYADDGTGLKPVGAGLPTPRPLALAQFRIPFALCNEIPSANPDHFEYSADLADADVPGTFTATAGVKYWIVIQIEMVWTPQWGVINSLDQQLAVAVQGFPEAGAPYWTTVRGNIDLAFKLTGECVVPGVCGNGILECSEECDTPDDDACPARCYPPGHDEECTCMPPLGACCIAYVCEFDGTEYECVELCGGEWYEGETCDEPDPFECPPPPLGACCHESEGEILCFTVNEEACDAIPGLWYEGEDCEGDPPFDCPTYCDGEDVIYHNGEPDMTIALTCQRRTDGTLEVWVVDDVTFPTAVTITDFHWWCATNATFDFQGTGDIIILLPDGPTGGPGTVVEEMFDVPNERIWWSPWGTGIEVYVYSIYNLNINLDPGAYWIGMRPVNQAMTGQSWWAVAPDNGTGQIWFRSAGFGYPDWVPGFDVFGMEYNVAFCLTGTAEALPGACCDPSDGQCEMKTEPECDLYGGTFLGPLSECTELDCNQNGVPDVCDVGLGWSEDCQPNDRPDECDIPPLCDPGQPGFPEECSSDCNGGVGNGIPDECEGYVCPWDHTGDCIVNPLDGNRVKDHYDCVYDFDNYTCPDPAGWDDPTCPEYDYTGDCVINPLDVNRVKDHYGPCP